MDIVIAYFEPHGRKDTIAKTEGLEVIPAPQDYLQRHAIRGDGHRSRSAPQARAWPWWTNSPTRTFPAGAHDKRWQDVRALLDAGIDVLTTMNVQHLESLNDQVWRVTGVRVRETVPDWVVDEADEVVFVDLTPQALRNRIERGVVYAPEKARRAMDNFFTETNLTALREIAMRHAAHEAEDKLRPAKALPLSGRHERILICLTGSPSSAILIRRGKRLADYLQADCIAVHVAGERRTGARGGGAAHELCPQPAHRHACGGGADIAAAIAGFARSQRITQIFMGRPGPRPLLKRLRESVVQQVVRQARDKQITIVAQRG